MFDAIYEFFNAVESLANYAEDWAYQTQQIVDMMYEAAMYAKPYCISLASVVVVTLICIITLNIKVRKLEKKLDAKFSEIIQLLQQKERE